MKAYDAVIIQLLEFHDSIKGGNTQDVLDRDYIKACINTLQEIYHQYGENLYRNNYEVNKMRMIAAEVYVYADNSIGLIDRATRKIMTLRRLTQHQYNVFINSGMLDKMVDYFNVMEAPEDELVTAFNSYFE